MLSLPSLLIDARALMKIPRLKSDLKKLLLHFLENNLWVSFSIDVDEFSAILVVIHNWLSLTVKRLQSQSDGGVVVICSSTCFRPLEESLSHCFVFRVEKQNNIAVANFPRKSQTLFDFPRVTVNEESFGAFFQGF